MRYTYLSAAGEVNERFSLPAVGFGYALISSSETSCSPSRVRQLKFTEITFEVVTDEPQELFAFTVKVTEVEVEDVNLTFTDAPVAVPTNVAPPETVHVYEVAPVTAATEYGTDVCVLHTEADPLIVPGCAVLAETAREVTALDPQQLFAFTVIVPVLVKLFP